MQTRAKIVRALRRAGGMLWRRKWTLCAATAATVAALAIGLAWPMDTDHYLRINASSQVVDRSGKLVYAFLSGEQQWQFPRTLNEISPHLVNATIAVEDKRYWEHAGVDLYAVARAASQNLTKARIHSGASTITMQVVKQADHLQRSSFGKLLQAWQAVRLERRAAKGQILEAYLNTAPYGLNLAGCESASRRYFGKPANELTLGEAALLAGLPKSPVGLMPLEHGTAALARRNYVLDRMQAEGFISAEECARTKAEPLRADWNEFPQRAPHLAMRLNAQVQPGSVVHTTIDLTLQEALEQQVPEALKQFDNEITNAAVMVVDTETAEIRARVGSANFFDTPGGGQVDSCRSLRSPGSALKPFTYALGLERNVLYAGEMLLDDSLDYGLYNPENYDGKYRGLVTASYALRRSLNVPAVTVLDRLGYKDLHRFLTGAGLTTLVKPAEYYGLGLTLGNCEIRLDQLTAAYCMLANLGEYQPLRDAVGEAAKPQRLLSRGTCLELYEMLEQEFPEEFQKDMVQGQGYVPRVCWKTGTSTGNHDAWAFVFNRQYVVGVWLGNNDGKSSKYLVGARAALPLAAKIFRALPKQVTPDWPDAGGYLRDISICADTGLPASKWCPHVSTARVPAVQFLNRRCDVHYPQPGTESDIVTRWPATAKGWDLAKVNAAVSVVATGNVRKEGLQILTPSDNAEFVMTQEKNADRIRVRASTDTAVDLHWYLDGQHLGISGPDSTLFLDLSEGHHTLTCMGPAGNTASVNYSVEAPYTPGHFRDTNRG